MKKVRLWVALVVMAALVAACGGSASDEQAEASAPSAAEATTAPAPTEPPPPTTDPEPTAMSEPTPTTEPTAAPDPTAIPQPVDVLTLADAKAGVPGTNWIAIVVEDGAPPETFDADGNPTTYYDTAPDGSTTPAYLEATSLFGNPHRLLVVDGSPSEDFVEVIIPGARPTGQTAWLRTADLTFESSDFVVGLDMSVGVVEVWRGGELVLADQDRDPTPRNDDLVLDGVYHWVESLPFEREGFHPYLLSISHVSRCDTCDFISQTSVRGEGPDFDREAFFAQLEAEGRGGRGYSLWITQDGLAKFMDLVPVGSRVEITGGSAAAWDTP